MHNATTSPTGASLPRRRARAASGAALAAALAFGAAAPALALPANPEPLGLTQPDGSAITVRTRGDENFNFTLNADDALILKDEGGTWRQVVAEEDGLALGADAGDSPAAGALTADDLTSDAARSALYALQGREYDGDRLSESTEPVTLDEIRAANRRSAAGVGFRSADTGRAELPLLLIVVGFKDQPYNTEYDWAKTFFTSKYSIKTLYDISSNGKFSWTEAPETSAYQVGGNTSPTDAVNDGILHVTLDRVYGDLDTTTTEGRANYLETLKAALDEASKYTDFSSYDANGDGAIEPSELGLGIVFAGYEAATGYVPAGQNGTWSHKWSFTSAQSEPYVIEQPGIGSPVSIDTYVIQSETEAYPAYEYQSGIGALGHELGHFLGLPDLYDTRDGSGPYSAYYTGYLSLMDGGSWGTTKSGEYRPTFFDPYSRIFLGYIEPTEITADGTYTVTSQMSDEGYSSYLIRVNEDEYYVIENRQYESFDRGMEWFFMGKGTIGSTAGAGEPDNSYQYENPTGGVVVWHIDNGIAEAYGLPANTVNVKTHRPGVMPAYLELKDFGNMRPLQYMPFLNNHTNRMLNNPVTPVLAYDGSDDPAGRVDTGIRISSTSDGAKSMTFTVDFPATISEATVNGGGSAVLESDGGSVDLAVTAENLSAGDVVTAQVFDGKTLIDTVTLEAGPADRSAAAGTALTGRATFPANTGDEDHAYSVGFALNGESAGGAVSVTVKAPEKPEPKPEPGATGSGDAGAPKPGDGNEAGQDLPSAPKPSPASVRKPARALPKTGDASLAILAGASLSGIGALAAARGIRRRR
ncbi:MAG: M6 family metalloprotease domain-containing protein [Collinsella sp.]|nr:M6 family metalloprotease domain-containing protein [Collinsella sp.]